MNTEVTPNKVRFAIAALIVLAIVLRVTGWVFPLDVRLWGMWLAGAGFGFVYGRAKLQESIWRQRDPKA